ncbi:hypothetical protein [Roseobacter sp. N2S]|uniref:hypothetical protein n=1 Tax=Roseobacter sp. N2S TaxID=2663844 RepID=UPI002864199C|nr:hypothetical protein [Roseobacter sp. N2S]MDR6266560.1 hypothetical protein [Roseobacter sp. N2S]
MRPKSAYAWRRPAQSRPSGHMPALINGKLLTYAREHNIPLTAEHLICGASAVEIDALLKDVAA